MICYLYWIYRNWISGWYRNNKYFFWITFSFVKDILNWNNTFWNSDSKWGSEATIRNWICSGCTYRINSAKYVNWKDYRMNGINNSKAKYEHWIGYCYT